MDKLLEVVGEIGLRIIRYWHFIVIGLLIGFIFYQKAGYEIEISQWKSKYETLEKTHKEYVEDSKEQIRIIEEKREREVIRFLESKEKAEKEYNEKIEILESTVTKLNVINNRMQISTERLQERLIEASREDLIEYTTTVNTILGRSRDLLIKLGTRADEHAADAKRVLDQCAWKDDSEEVLKE